VPCRQHDLSGPLRPWLAHHGLHRHARRPRRVPGCWASMPRRRRWRWGSRRRSPLACASSSGR
jgi:hypothetical protein